VVLQRVLPAFPDISQGRLAARLTSFTASPAIPIAASAFIPAVNFAIQINIPILSQQAIRVVSLDMKLSNGDAVPGKQLIVHSMGAQLDGNAAGIRQWSSRATMGLPLGVLNFHESELDLTYWSDWAANGGVMPNLVIGPDITIENTDAVNVHQVFLQMAAIVELYDFSLAGQV